MTAGIPAALAELTEAETLFQFEANAPADVRSTLGMAGIRLGGGVALSMRTDPTRYWSKASGFGFTEPVTADLIAQVCDFYRAEGTSLAVLQLAPAVIPEDWPDICARHGISAGGTWVKLVRDLAADAEPPADSASGADPQPDGSLRVAPVNAEQAAEWGSVMMRGFEMPVEGLAEMAAANVGRPNFHPFAAWHGADLVAISLLRVQQDVGHMFGATTLPAYRRRGAQSAFLAARAHAASAAGCRWLVAETGREAPGAHNQSLHNMLRAGFSVRYERQNWIWRPASGS